MLGTVLVALLERTDAVEPTAVGTRVVLVGTRLVANGHHARNARVELTVRDLERVATAGGHVGGPGPCVAVGLQLEIDRAAPDGSPFLDGVRELVGEHDADGERPVRLVELRDQGCLVPGDQVLRRAVEGVAGDVVVADGCRPTPGELRVRAVGLVTTDQGLERAPVDLGIRVAPVRLDVVDRAGDQGVEVIGRHRVGAADIPMVGPASIFPGRRAGQGVLVGLLCACAEGDAEHQYRHKAAGP
jgi:hypothetical protein